jgi:sugar phosphate isomerase/epimerase
LSLANLRDFVFDKAAQPKDVIIGEGNLCLNSFIDALKEIDFNGNLILEFEGDINNPIPALKKCIDNIKMVLK